MARRNDPWHPTGVSSTTGTWIRLEPFSAFNHYAGLFSTDRDWLARGMDPTDLGLLQLTPALHRAAVQLPQLSDVLVDLYSPTRIRIVRIAPGAIIAEPEILTEAQFPDPHPVPWVAHLARDLRLILAVGPDGPRRFTTMKSWMDTWRVAVLPVARRMDDSGIGIVGP